MNRDQLRALIEDVGVVPSLRGVSADNAHRGDGGNARPAASASDAS
jgi:hypothetical protein